MAETSPPVPVKYFVAALFSSSQIFEKAKQKMSTMWGIIDYCGKARPFDVTDYYNEEMGGPQLRQIITFTQIKSPVILAAMKLQCNELELELQFEGKRVVNLDVGYLDHNKVLLASAKEAGQKVYLDKGIYADLAGRYRCGKYQPFEWSFPDFKDGRYDQELCEIRAIYMKQVKEWRKDKKD